jgi:hypothetical protein
VNCIALFQVTEMARFCNKDYGVKLHEQEVTLSCYQVLEENPSPWSLVGIIFCCNVTEQIERLFKSPCVSSLQIENKHAEFQYCFLFQIRQRVLIKIMLQFLLEITASFI